jgi:hypothetical protein
MRRSLLASAAVLLGCSSPAADGGDPAGTGPAGTGPAGTGASAEAATAEQRLPYPPAPYGASPGATIEDFRFLGWSQPADAKYDTGQLRPLSLAEFYDPRGVKAVRYVVITSTAVWCSACKLEYRDFASGKVEAYQKRGVRFLGALFQANDGTAATPGDLADWAKRYKVTFPFVLDPALKFGAFFDVEKTPMEMIVDARDMKIVQIDHGWATKGDLSIWTALDGLLAR